jgi:oligopeptidase A
MTNPLLDHTLLPLFSKLKPEHVEPAIDQLLADARAAIDQHLQATSAYTWENLIEPIDNANDTLDKAWSPVSHINSVLNSDELRAAYNACLPKLSQYGTEIGQNTALFNAYRTIADSTGFKALDIAQQKTISNALRDFKLSGVDLDADKKQRYQDICQALSKLASSYEENLMDASNAWTKLIADTGQLAGLPESALAQALQAAKQEDKTGWLLTLQFPSYYAVMTYADNRDLRQEVYTAYCTRASDQAQSAAQWDNSAIMAQILALRHDKAQLLGFNNFAELSLATKMADTADEVIGFLEDLAVKSKPQALADLAELRAYAKQHYGMDDLQPWDMGYYSEKMREYLYEFSEEQVKAYFPITRVLPGLFAIVNKLYGLQITEITEFDSWHPDVQFFQIHDKTGQLRGQFYIDLYARPKKRGGAWMDDCVNRKKTSQGIQTPVAYLTCNFSSPTGNDPALLTHDEVITLFHEFGHGLHHMLTQVDYLGVSGIHGVEWDAVELPSQFMENWCWENEALALISGHYQTGEPLPKDLFDKMTAAKNFQAGMIMVRQLEFSLFDFKIHLNYDPAQGGRIYEILEQVRNQVSVVKAPAFNRFAHGFSHIFAGGYAAGYYSYKWAEVLSSDAFSLFEEQGIFNPEVGNAFLTNVLEKGGSQNAMELFTNFRGRKPNIDALLRHNGIAV